MKAQVSYLAMVSEDPDKLASFYKTHFGLRELGHSPAGAGVKSREQGRRARFAGDGNTAWAILPMRATDENDGNVEKPGMNHVGFVVPDMEAMLGKLPPEARAGKRPANRPFAEYRTFD